MKDDRIPEGVVPAPEKPPVPGSILSEVSPLSPEIMGQRLGDVDYRVELEPELATTSLGQLAYWDIWEKTGGDVSQYIKNVMGNPETGYVMGDDPADPIYGTNTRATYDGSGAGKIRVNATDLLDMYGQKGREALQQSGGDVSTAHELGHYAIDLLKGKLPPGAARFYEEDIMEVLDAVGVGHREGDVSPPWRGGLPGYVFSNKSPTNPETWRKDSEGRDVPLNYARTAAAVLSENMSGLNSYEQGLATFIIDLNQVAAEELASRKQTSYRDRLK